MESSVVVIGAGVVGCATAYELSSQNLDVIVLEMGPRIAEGVTSRNSGVIHSGIYYPPGSLKAECCIQGNSLLYEWCQKKGVSFQKTGKWVIAQKHSEGDLYDLYQNAMSCGVRRMRFLSQKEIAEEPAVHCSSALLFEDTGIVDPYEYARSFQCAAEEKEAQFIFNAKVTEISARTGGGYFIETTRGSIEADRVVNCAGLFADEIAKMAGIDHYRIYPWRGDYFTLKCPISYKHLIYPVKKKGAPGLGVHLTLGLDGSKRLGPDVQSVLTKDDYSPPQDVNSKREAFFEGARAFLPDIQLSQLSYDSCGIRPKLRSPTEKEERDFVLSQDLPGWINLIGIESPGLTSSHALAKKAAALF